MRHAVVWRANSAARSLIRVLMQSQPSVVIFFILEWWAQSTETILLKQHEMESYKNMRNKSHKFIIMIDENRCRRPTANVGQTTSCENPERALDSTTHSLFFHFEQRLGLLSNFLSSQHQVTIKKKWTSSLHILWHFRRRTSQNELASRLRNIGAYIVWLAQVLFR